MKSEASEFILPIVNSVSHMEAPNTILIVDDVPDNLQVLAQILEAEGYKVRKAVNGQVAIRTATLAPPDLILLDITMAGMDGYTVCQSLKADPKTATIPIIFISALDNTDNKVKGLELGGVDYITKPFQEPEVLARVKIQLQIYTLQQHLRTQAKLLQQQNEQLQAEIQTRQQVEAHLREAEIKYRSIFENANEGIFQITAEGQYLAANPALARIFGYDSVADLMASTTDIGQLYVDPKRRQELIAYLKHYQRISDAESEVYRQDKQKIWISEGIRAVYNSNGKFLFYEGTVQDITERRTAEQTLRQERMRSERLLVNVLPQKIAQRLKTNPIVIADSLDDASVLFADLVNFTAMSLVLPAQQVVELLNQIFSAFDDLVEHYGLEKIKTIGDAYMVAGGVPVPRADHLDAIANLALDMQQTIQQFSQPDGHPFCLRIGINAGPLVAGVISKKKFTYDLWGNTVNLASRMEATSLSGKIQVPAVIYEQLKTKFVFEPRGSICAQGIGQIETYFLCDRLQSPESSDTALANYSVSDSLGAVIPN